MSVHQMTLRNSATFQQIEDATYLHQMLCTRTAEPNGPYWYDGLKQRMMIQTFFGLKPSNLTYFYGKSTYKLCLKAIADRKKSMGLYKFCLYLCKKYRAKNVNL